MIEQLMNAFADSELDCHDWGDVALRELAIIAINTIRDVSRTQVIDTDILDAILHDAGAE